jgi:hypothetical protein
MTRDNQLNVTFKTLDYIDEPFGYTFEFFFLSYNFVFRVSHFWGGGKHGMSNYFQSTEAKIKSIPCDPLADPGNFERASKPVLFVLV